MNFIKTQIDGLMIIEPKIFADSRGYFFESYNQKLFFENGITNNFVQDNQSKSSYGVIRGLHAQSGEHAQAKLVRVLEGRVLDVAVDIREGSPTYGQHLSIELSSENQRQFFIPRGFLHAFAVLSETAIFSYKCDNLYNKESEIGVCYNDKALNIDWKIEAEKISVSDKDLIHPPFEKLLPYRA